MPSWGPRIGRNCYITLAFTGSLEKGTKSEVATSPLPSRGSKIGQKCFATLAFSGVPRKVDIIRRRYITPTFSEAQDWAEELRNPCVLGGPQKRG